MAQTAKKVEVFLNDEGQFQARFFHADHPISVPDLKRIIKTLQVSHKHYLLEQRLETRRRMAADEAKRGKPQDEVTSNGGA